MAEHALENICNLALLSHNSAGKTSLAEAILFNAKVINRLGKVDDGSSTSDYDPAEQKRNISISLSMLPYEWQGKKINLIDTPGYPDFVGEAKEEDNKPAYYSMKNALAVEEIHHGLFLEALEAVRTGADLVQTEIFVCSVCGNTVYDEPPEKCPVCGAPRDKFFEVK